jgi:hypothetical protein
LINLEIKLSAFECGRSKNNQVVSEGGLRERASCRHNVL